MLHPKPFSTAQQLSYIRQSLKSIINTTPNLTLFDKLQYYDRLVASQNVSRVDPNILTIFEELLESHGDEPAKAVNQMHYSSPPSHKRDQIEDPQLFSFSKTRKQEKQYNHGSSMLTKTRLPNNKQKNLTDKPKQSKFPQSSNDISEFMENQQANHNQSNNSLHQLSKSVRNLLLKNRLRILIQNGRKSLEERRKLLKLRSSEYYYDLNLTKKTFRALNQHKIWQQEGFKQIKQLQQDNKLASYFMNWRQYAFRSEQQRQNEVRIKENSKFLMKKMSIVRFIRNSQTIEIEGSERQQITYGRQLKKIKNQLHQKQINLVKRIFLNRMMNKLRVSKQIPQKMQHLTQLLRSGQLQVFRKLLECSQMVEKNREELMEREVRVKIYGRSLINKLKEEYFFQKSYWVSFPNKNLPQREDSEQIKNLPFLNNQNVDWKYQKIVFIKEIFDLAEHSLHRKGYQPNPDSQTISNLIEKHPAYKKFYLVYKLGKYFSALKGYFAELSSKQQKLKYQIQGRRVYESTLCWYRDHIQTQIIRQDLDGKSQYLRSLLSEKRKQQFMHEFCKMTERKQEQLSLDILMRKKLRAVKILKAYRISKRYYVYNLYEHHNNSQKRLMESCFLSWKLYQAEKTHERMMVRQCRRVQQKYAIRRIIQNINSDGLLDRLHRQKEKNLMRCRTIDWGDIFLTKLIHNYQCRGKVRQGRIESLQERKKKLEKALVKLKVGRVWKNLQKNRNFRTLTNKIMKQIDKQYENRIKYKILKAFVGCKEYRQNQKQKMQRIATRAQMNMKKAVMEKMAGKMVERIILKRTCQSLRKAWLDFGWQVFTNNI